MEAGVISNFHCLRVTYILDIDYQDPSYSFYIGPMHIIGPTLTYDYVTIRIVKLSWRAKVLKPKIDLIIVLGHTRETNGTQLYSITSTLFSLMKKNMIFLL